MAETLFMKDGTIEVILNTNGKRRFLKNLIGERLGIDCERLFDEIIADTEKDSADGDDYERIADEYRAMLLDTIEELDALLLLFGSPRLNRSVLQAKLRNCRNNLYNNL